MRRFWLGIVSIIAREWRHIYHTCPHRPLPKHLIFFQNTGYCFTSRWSDEPLLACWSVLDAKMADTITICINHVLVCSMFPCPVNQTNKVHIHTVAHWYSLSAARISRSRWLFSTFNKPFPLASWCMDLWSFHSEETMCCSASSSYIAVPVVMALTQCRNDSMPSRWSNVNVFYSFMNNADILEKYISKLSWPAYLENLVVEPALVSQAFCRCIPECACQYR